MTASKNINVGLLSDIYEYIWFKFSMIIDASELYILIYLIDLDLDSRLQQYKKAESCASIILQSFQFIWMEFSILLRFVSVMNLILILSHPFNIQGREPYLCDFVFVF